MEYVPYICRKFEPNSGKYFIDMVHLEHVKIKGFFPPGQIIANKKLPKNQRVVISYLRGDVSFCCFPLKIPPTLRVEFPNPDPSPNLFQQERGILPRDPGMVP